jgi:hypothetical protein
MRLPVSSSLDGMPAASRGASLGDITSGQQSLPGSPTGIEETRETMRKFLLIFAFFFVVLPIRATDLYIAQTATGGNTGADCSDAHPYTFFNNSSNWPSPIGPGTTVHICGTITAPAGASGFLGFHGGGSNGNPVTLKFENGAVLTAPYWGTQGAIAVSGVSYAIVDGGSNGIVQATANGTGLTYQQNGAGVWLSNCSNCEVKNLSISDIYSHNGLNDENGGGSYSIYWLGGSNVTIDHNTVDDAKWCLYFAYPGSTTTSTVNIYSNTAFNCDHGVVVGDGNGSAILTGANSIHDNTIHDFSNWDDNQNQNHHDGIHVWAAHTGSQITGLSIYNNYIYGQPGTHMNADIYLAGGIGTITGSYVFNNVMANPNSAAAPASGFVADFGTNTNILNNTMQGASTSNTGGECILTYLSGGTIRNNVCSAVYVAIYIEPGASIGTSDYNDFSNPNAVAFNNKVWYSTVATWQSSAGKPDSHSISGHALLTGSLQLGTGSAAIGTGTNLSELGVNALNFDKAGTPRPTGSTPWDMGAFQSGGDSSTAPNAPTGLTAVVNQ